jgi:PAS domain S-box-containing protein
MQTQKNKHAEPESRIADWIINLAPGGRQDIASLVFDAINSIINGLIITDLKGNICFANPSFCRMFEYDVQTIIGKNAAVLFKTKEVRKWSDVISIIDVSKDDKEEFIVRKGDDSTFVVEVSASNVTTSQKQLMGRVVSFLDITARKEVENDREKLINKLQNALDTIKTVRGIIPICSYCKKIRNDRGAWDQMEAYISDHSEAMFSHGICPECYDKMIDKME